jgi:hypothetical protein
MLRRGQRVGREMGRGEEAVMRGESWGDLKAPA